MTSAFVAGLSVGFVLGAAVVLAGLLLLAASWGDP